jgi:hypothetical protein
MAGRLQRAVDWLQSRQTTLPAADRSAVGVGRPGAVHPSADPIDAKRYTGSYPSIALPGRASSQAPRWAGQGMPTLPGVVTDRGTVLPGRVQKGGMHHAGD